MYQRESDISTYDITKEGDFQVKGEQVSGGTHPLSVDLLHDHYSDKSHGSFLLLKSTGTTTDWCLGP